MGGWGAAVDLTGYFVVGSRLVRIFRPPDGGLDCQALNWQTGEFERALGLIVEIHMGGGDDIREGPEEEFEGRVGTTRPGGGAAVGRTGGGGVALAAAARRPCRSCARWPPARSS